MEPKTIVLAVDAILSLRIDILSHLSAFYFTGFHTTALRGKLDRQGESAALRLGTGEFRST